MFQVGCGGTFEYLLAVCRYGYFTVQVDQLVAQIEYQSPVTRRGIMFLELHFDAPVRIGLNRLIGYIVDLQGDRVVRNSGNKEKRELRRAKRVEQDVELAPVRPGVTQQPLVMIGAGRA